MDRAPRRTLEKESSQLRRYCTCRISGCISHSIVAAITSISSVVLQQPISIDLLDVNVQSFSSSFSRVVCTESDDETLGVCSAVSSVMNSSSSYFLYLIQNTTVWTASTMAGAAQIQTRFGSLIAGVRISPRAEERAVVNKKSDLK
jgi:hypothetical protein